MAPRVKPLTLAQANAFVAELHRHHQPATGHRFSLGLFEGDKLVGVAIVGRPVAHRSDQYEIAEVSRLCTDGSANACSMLYGACARVAKEMGFRRIQTFILESEPGTSLKASGWVLDGLSAGGDWNRKAPERSGRKTSQPQGPKSRWVKDFRAV